MKIIIKDDKKDIEYDSKDNPIIIVLSPFDREKISNCPPGSVIYGVCPEGKDNQEIMEWIESKK